MAAVAHGAGWTVVKRGPTTPAGGVAFVGGIVRTPSRIGVRAVVARPRSIAVTVTLSCRRGIKIRVGRSRVTVAAPGVRTLVLPLTGAERCAVSATGSNPGGTLRLELLRGA